MINKKKLHETLEEVAVEWVNKVGVDINKVIRYQHLRSPLQFIAGLGPRKAAYLIKNIKEKCPEGFLVSRNDIEKLKLV